METEKIKLIVRPGAASNSVEAIIGDRIKIKISAQPQKGKANKALVSFIAAKTGIPKKDIRILTGETSNFKEIEIIKNNEINIFSLLAGLCNKKPE
jgi:uncharacterized protein